MIRANIIRAPLNALRRRVTVTLRTAKDNVDEAILSAEAAVM